MTIFGIDLGTTYSCIAYIDDSGRPVIAKNRIGEDATPSVVFFENDTNVVVGREAKNCVKISPDLVVSLIKRKMGEPDVRLDFHGVPHSPETISALILKELARSAAEYTNEEVTDVVITVPAYFGVAEREATRNAGRIAGLNVLNLVPEPVAAALHYDTMSAGADQTILVYDLGGGTFDTTVIRLRGNDVSVVCTDGDHRLGGADWDERLADHLLTAFLAEHPGSEAADSEDFLQELASAAEDLKKALSSVESRRHNLRFAGQTARVELTREGFEQLTADLLERTFQITERTVALARERGVAAFDHVLLVGGSTRMPGVADGLRERFGFEPRLLDPDLAVAKGAALFALIESVKVALPGDGTAAAGPLDEAAVNDVADRLGIAPDRVQELAARRVTTVVPRAFGVRIIDFDNPQRDSEDAVIDHVLHANDPLPATPPSRDYYTLDDNTVRIALRICEQAGATESARTSDNREIGLGVITELPRLPKNSPVEVTFAMGETGNLRVRGMERSTGKDVVVDIQIDGLTVQEVARATDQITRYSVGS
jgi:molecular chaperone DnaK